MIPIDSPFDGFRNEIARLACVGLEFSVLQFVLQVRVGSLQGQHQASHGEALS